MFQEWDIGIFGFAVLAIFQIGFSVFVPKDFGFSVLVLIAVNCGFTSGFWVLVSDAGFGFFLVCPIWVSVSLRFERRRPFPRSGHIAPQ